MVTDSELTFSPDLSLPLAPHVPCLWHTPPAENALTFLYFHGNAEDLGCCAELCAQMRAELGVGVMAVEYPGYGLLGG